jgi:hypothetical protein
MFDFTGWWRPLVERLAYFGLIVATVGILVWAWGLEPIFWQPFMVDSATGVLLFVAVRLTSLKRILIWPTIVLVTSAISLIVAAWALRQHPYQSTLLKDVGLGVLLFIALEVWITKRLKELEREEETMRYERFAGWQGLNDMIAAIE